MLKRVMFFVAALLLPLSLQGGEAITCKEACEAVLITTCEWCPWGSCNGYHEGQGQCCECSLEGHAVNCAP
jgi:hypothetical protein